MKKLITFFGAILLYGAAYGQHKKIAPFKDGEVVCFVGNSITHAGEFHHNIFQYYLTRFPERKIQFYNTGISGDVTGGILKRMDDDILVHKPTTVVIMIGMNDVLRNLYTTNLNPGGDTLQRRSRALVTYRHNLDSIVRIFLVNHIRVILQKPSIYDQTATIPRPNNLGVNDALNICAGYMQELADQYHLDIVDYWTIMSEINARLQKADPAATIVGADRIHPGMVGHQIMAYQFIHSTDFSPNTINIVIKSNIKESNKQSFKAEIQSLDKKADILTFKTREFALPYALRPSAIHALDMIPLTDSINNERLQVDQLSRGIYELRINGLLIGTFTSGQLEKGINLASYTNTPQYTRSLAIRKFLDDNLFPVEANWRAIKAFEYRYLAGYKNIADTASLRQIVYDRNKVTIETVKPALNKYIDLQSQRAGMLDKIRALNADVHAQAAPGVYLYQLKKIN